MGCYYKKKMGTIQFILVQFKVRRGGEHFEEMMIVCNRECEDMYVFYYRVQKMRKRCFEKL